MLLSEKTLTLTPSFVPQEGDSEHAAWLDAFSFLPEAPADAHAYAFAHPDNAHSGTNECPSYI